MIKLKTTLKDVGDCRTLRRYHHAKPYVGGYVRIECPWCGNVCTTRPCVLAKQGYRCHGCGALHTRLHSDRLLVESCGECPQLHKSRGWDRVLHFCRVHCAWRPMDGKPCKEVRDASDAGLE